HAETVRIQRLPGGFDQSRMVGEAEVIVGAEVQHLAAIGQRDLGGLWRGDDALVLVQAGIVDGFEFLAETVLRGVGHGQSRLTNVGARHPGARRGSILLSRQWSKSKWIPDRGCAAFGMTTSFMLPSPESRVPSPESRVPSP